MKAGDLKFTRFGRMCVGFGREMLELQMGQAILILEYKVFKDDDNVKILTAGGVKTVTEYEITMYTNQFDDTCDYEFK